MGGRKESDEPKDEFIVLFTALGMILLAFFILLNTMAVIDPMRSREAIDSLVGTFGVMPGHHKGEPRPPTRERDGRDPVAALLVEIEGADRFRGFEIERRADGLAVVRMEGDVLFASGGIEPDPSALLGLRRIAHTLNASRSIEVRVEGHTDRRPGSGERTNLWLSAARAARVAALLEHGCGAPPGTIEAVGFAAVRPDPRERDPDGARHRRVEITLRQKPQEDRARGGGRGLD